MSDSTTVPADRGHEPQLSAISRPRGGWFYRAVAPAGKCRVLEVGRTHVGNWFQYVDRVSVLPQAATAPRYELVVVHDTLGGRSGFVDLFAGAAQLLMQGGVLVCGAKNVLARAKPAAAPRTTGRALRSAMRDGGFSDVRLFTAHPDGLDTVVVVDTRKESARPFFRNQMEARRWRRLSPRRIAWSLAVATNVMPFLQPHFLVVGTKC